MLLLLEHIKCDNCQNDFHLPTYKSTSEFDHGVYMNVVYIWKWSSAHALGGVSGVASFITTDEQLQ